MPKYVSAVQSQDSAHPGEGHINIDTVLSTKTVRFNCRTYTTPASIIGAQTKPRAGVAMTNDIIGMEFEPGIDAGFASTGGIVAIKANPIYRVAAGNLGGNIDGDVRGVECQLGGNSASGGNVSTRTIGGTMSCLKCVNDVHAAAVTGGIWPLYVPAAGGGNKAWSGLAKLPNDGAMANNADSSKSSLVGWIKVQIGTLTGYIPVNNLA